MIRMLWCGRYLSFLVVSSVWKDTSSLSYLLFLLLSSWMHHYSLGEPSFWNSHVPHLKWVTSFLRTSRPVILKVIASVQDLIAGDIMQGHSGLLIRTVCIATLTSSRPSLVAGAYQVRQPDHSFSSEPGRAGEGNVAHSHFQHRIVVPGSALRQIEILWEKVSFP